MPMQQERNSEWAEAGGGHGQSEQIRRYFSGPCFAFLPIKEVQ